MTKRSFFFLLLCAVSFTASAFGQTSTKAAALRNPYLSTSKPFTRWWWFASVIKEEDVRANLDWLKANNFGGVEIAWVYPLNRMKKDSINYTPRQAWLGEEWKEIVAYTKRYADKLGLGCDFTFGTLWPFGDMQVTREEATRQFADTSWRQEIKASWDYPKTALVVDHLQPKAFGHYADRMLKALPEHMSPVGTAFFCDSWEVETRGLWTTGFDRDFKRRFGYDVLPFMDSIYTQRSPDVRYDYMKLLSDKVIGFYRQFTDVSHRGKALSRAQCMGAPCDLMTAYAAVDIPETEAMLFEPDFSRIVASAAALSQKKAVTSETFTCLYGWPRIHLGEEQTADLKLVADALFANGMNHVIWHGKPINPAGTDSVKFYASVHVGSTGSLSAEIPEFNSYLEKVSSYMKKGRTYSDVAVYLPTEDAWMAGDLPKNKQFIWAWGAYEMRYVYPPEEVSGYQPLWINQYFLDKAKWKNGRLRAGDLEFSCLYVDVQYLDLAALKRIVALARQGLPVCLKRAPSEPGKNKSRDYAPLLETLVKLKNVSSDFPALVKHRPLIEMDASTDYWCREDGKNLYLFISHPKSYRLKFPIRYGQSLTEDPVRAAALITLPGKEIVKTELVFKPYQSLLLKISEDGAIEPIDITFVPKTPVVKEREQKGKEAWEVE